MDISIRRLGEHRGSPRLYLDTMALTRAGFAPGTAIRIDVHSDEGRIAIHTCAAGGRRVSQKRRGSRCLPVIDLNSASDLAPVLGLECVRVIFTMGVIHILALASQRRAALRLARLQARLAAGLPLHTAGIAFGAGVASTALHAGLKQAGVNAKLVLANEIRGDVSEVALANNAVLDRHTIMIQAPMQEAIADDWLLRQLPEVDLLEAGIPCSGASRAGVAKRGLLRMEDHPAVGHLVVAWIQWIATLQPAIVIGENVVDYKDSASASLIRAWLRDAGYCVREMVLDARDFDSLEARLRWFIVAYPPELDLGALDALSLARSSAVSRLSDVLEAVPDDDPSYRTVGYLKTKEQRDADKGSRFLMQWLTPASTSVPVLRRGYHKAGSTDPRLVHPSDPQRSRLLTAVEHARIKGIAPELLQGLSSSLAHEVCGQSVDVRPMQALGTCLGEALLQLLAAKAHHPRQPLSRPASMAAPTPVAA